MNTDSGVHLHIKELYMRRKLIIAKQPSIATIPLCFLSSFGVVLMSCKVNFQVVRSALQYSACECKVYPWDNLFNKTITI